MSRILSIAKNTFREAVRDRVLYNLVLFVLLLIVCAIFLGDLTDGQEGRTIVNIGLNAMLLFGTFIAIFVGTGLVSKEIDKRTIFAVFSKPVKRGEFIVGKYFGLCLTLLVNVMVMAIGVAAALLYTGDTSLAGSIWGSVYLIFLELCITTAVAILFSSFSSPSLSALLTFLIFVIGHMSAALLDLATRLESAAAMYLFGGMYYLLPNLSHFSFRTEAANGLTPNAPMIIGGTAYAATYIAILLTITIVIFQRRNFK